MIHTDGRPTIASYGSPPAPVTSGAVALLEDVSQLVPRQLLEREAAGVRVEIVSVAGGLLVRLTEAIGTSGERELLGAVPDNKAFDAFEHPYLYVSA